MLDGWLCCKRSNTIPSSANFASRIFVCWPAASEEEDAKSSVDTLYDSVSFARCVILGAWVMRWMCRVEGLDGGERSMYVDIGSSGVSSAGDGDDAGSGGARG